MNQPLRIVHVYNQLDPTNGGPPHVIVGLISGQQALGHDITLISEDPDPCPALDRFLKSHLERVPRRYAIHPRILLPRLTRKPLMSSLKGADIVHIHGIWPTVSMLASAACRKLDIPYVIAPHGSLHKGALDEKRLKKLIGMWTLGYRPYIACADAMHLLNEDEARGASHPAYVGVRLPKRRVVIPNGIFSSMLESPPAIGSFSEVVPAIAGKPYILFLSRLHHGKGLDILGDAFAHVVRKRPDTHLVIVGQDQGALSDVTERAQRHGYQDNLHLTGPLFDRRKYSAYRDAAVFCLPSRHEGFSMAITEAMAWRLPVVISTACHFPEVSRGRCGIEVELEPKALASALLTVLDNPEGGRSMGERGHRLVMDSYTWPGIAKQTLDLYRSVIDARGCA